MARYSKVAVGFGKPFVTLAQKPVVASTDPATDDLNYALGTLWVNKTTGSIFGLSRIESGLADWESLGGSASDVNTLTASTGGALFPTAGTINIVGDGGVTTTGTGSTITISGAGAALAWTEVAGTTQSAAINTGYLTANVGLTTVTLPAVAAVGSVIRVAASGAGGFTIAQNAAGIIHFLDQSTTLGVTGSLSSSAQYQSVEIVCMTANNVWMVLDSSGNLTVA